MWESALGRQPLVKKGASVRDSSGDHGVSTGLRANRPVPVGSGVVELGLLRVGREVGWWDTRAWGGGW